MKIFILDDSFDRINTLVNLLEKKFIAEITIAATAEYAKRVFKLGHNEFDIMFLDHDLGGKVYVDSDEEETGYQVAKYMIENDIKCEQVIVHTLNYAGAQNMINLLTGKYLVYYIPFPSLIKSLG